MLTSGAQQQTRQTTTTTAAASQSEPEDISGDISFFVSFSKTLIYFSNCVSEHQVMRIQTEQAPVPSQPEVVLSDGKSLCLQLFSAKEKCDLQFEYIVCLSCLS